MSVRHLDRKNALSRITIRAKKDIVKGEELFATYVDPALSLVQRRREHKPWAFGTCMCPKCVREEKEEAEKKKEEGEDGVEKEEGKDLEGLEEELREGLGLV